VKRISIYLFAFSFVLNGCGSKESKQNKELEKLAMEVMAVHDRSMPNHGKLFRLETKLISILDCYDDSIVKAEVNSVLLDVEKADRDMMHWMHNYTVPEDFMPFEEKKAYFIEQKKMIEDVEVEMNRTIDRSNQLIKRYPIKKECTGF
jgi:hypothetical protein